MSPGTRNDRDVADTGLLPVWNSTIRWKTGVAREIRDADAVIVGSYVPDGVDVARLVHRRARGVTAFYDIDTPVTLAKLQRGDFEYSRRK